MARALLGRRRVLMLAAAGAAAIACQAPEPTPTARPPARATAVQPASAARPAPTSAPTGTTGPAGPSPQRALDDLLRDRRGRFGVAARDLTGTTSIEIAPRERFELASLYKVVLMAEVMRQVKGGQRRLSDAVETLAEYDFGEPEGGVPPGTRLTVDEALAATIQVSSNAAALAMIELIGAPALAAAPARFGMADTTIEAQSLGKGHYWIDSLGSARDLVELLARIGRRQAVDAALDQRMADYLLGQRVDDRLPVGLPHSVRIAHKTGDDEDFTHDAGLVLLSRRPYAVAVLTQAESVADGKSAIVEVSRLLYGYFSATA